MNDKESTDLVRFGTATTPAEARALAASYAQRKYGRLTDEKLKTGAANDYRRVCLYAGRMMDASLDFGFRLLEIKRRTPRGGFESACEELGVSKTQAHRFRALVEAVPLLPATPPGGGKWSIDQAIEFSKTAGDFIDDDHALTRDAVAHKVAVHLKAKRKARASAQLAGAIVRLEAQIRQALAEGDSGALSAIDMIAHTARRLEDEAKRYAADADRQREDDDRED
jgi:hypothetical protein